MDSTHIIEILEAMKVTEEQILDAIEELSGLSQKVDRWIAKRFKIHRAYTDEFIEDLRETPSKYRIEQVKVLRERMMSSRFGRKAK